MRFLKALGAYVGTLVVLAFIEWGPNTWIPGLIGLVVAIVVWLNLKPEEPAHHDGES